MNDAALYSNQWKVASPLHAKGFLSNEGAEEKKSSPWRDEDGVHDISTEDDYGTISSPFFPSQILMSNIFSHSYSYLQPSDDITKLPSQVIESQIIPSLPSCETSFLRMSGIPNAASSFCSRRAPHGCLRAYTFQSNYTQLLIRVEFYSVISRATLLVRTAPTVVGRLIRGQLID